MSSFFQIEITHEGIGKGEQHLVNRVVRESLTAMGLEWRERYLPIHFTKRGARRYGYAARSGDRGSGKKFTKSYQGRKLRQKGHTLPLVWSGEGRTEALASDQVIAKATSKRAHVTLPLPRKFNFKNPKSNANMRAEISAVTPEEIRTLEGILVAEIEEHWQKLNTTKQYSVRISA